MLTHGDRMGSSEELIRERRALLKSLFPEFEKERNASDQQKEIPAPPLEKLYPKNAVLIDLVDCDATEIGDISLKKAIGRRQSRRKYSDASLTMEELSFLLWATQGIRAVDKNQVWTRRTVPSGGARQPFETYLIINRVSKLDPGVYRYLPLEHKLIKLKNKPPTPGQIAEACLEQVFIGHAAVVFVWTTVPYRAEWRYSTIAYKAIAVESGHICQNLYLACEAIGAGTCAILAYDQKVIDKIIGVDGEDEFTVYLAPVGKTDKKLEKD